MQSGEVAARRVDPYLLLFQGRQFYLVGYSHERSDVRVFRLSRIRGKVAYATKAEHDFQRPADFDPREYASRIPWQLGGRRTPPRSGCRTASPGTSSATSAPYGEIADGDLPHRLRDPAAGDRVGARLRRARPHHRPAGARRRGARAARRDRRAPHRRAVHQRRRGHAAGRRGSRRAEAPPRSRQEAAIRPERFARLVTLASVLIAAGRAGRRPPVSEVLDRLQISEQELREDISVLNVVNFGGGAYVIYAEVQGDEIEIDTEPYSDTFDRPARLLPIEANALMAAIEFLGTHLSRPACRRPTTRSRRRSARSAATGSARRRHRRGRLRHRARRQPRDRVAQPDRARVLAAERGHDLRAQGRAVRADERARGLVHRLLRPVARRHALVPARPREARDRARRGLRAARELDEIATSRAGRAPARSRARASPTCGSRPSRRAGRARSTRCWPSCPTARSIIEWAYKGEDYLVKEVLKEAGDAAVLEPADAREAVLRAAERLLVAAP